MPPSDLVRRKVESSLGILYSEAVPVFDKSSQFTARDFAYLFFFATLCVAFVPVPFGFGRNSIVVPISAILFDGMLRYARGGATGIALFGWLWMTLYALGFLLLGCFTIRFSRKFRDMGMAPRFRRGMLGLIGLSSFLPLITYSSSIGQGGRYSFWTALIRYFERWA